ncbi:MAG: citrate lyase holo-[acyl-carrier protein] synthase [Synergistaceae bacterium]|nr:citrate lyase holo-[acyl-carrier protein] synthase [Synergistaceae bacterium]
MKKTAKNDIENAINEILSSKEERVKIRDKNLSENVFACQITLNIPGYPKRMLHDERALEKFRRGFLEKWDLPPLSEKKITNAAGVCWIGFFAGDLATAKKAKGLAVSIEETTPQGRISDIDIVTQGKSISRSDLGLPPRTCLVCGKPAKECARNCSHSYKDLRLVIEELIKNI